MPEPLDLSQMSVSASRRDCGLRKGDASWPPSPHLRRWEPRCPDFHARALMGNVHLAKAGGISVDSVLLLEYLQERTIKTMTDMTPQQADFAFASEPSASMALQFVLRSPFLLLGGHRISVLAGCERTLCSNFHTSRCESFFVGNRPTPTLLRLISGESAKHPERLRSDRPKSVAPPALPVGAVLSPAGRATWDWLIETNYVPSIHSPGGGPAFLKVARLLTRVNEIDRKLQTQGCLIRHPKSNKPSISPNAKILRALGDVRASTGSDRRDTKRSVSLGTADWEKRKTI